MAGMVNILAAWCSIHIYSCIPVLVYGLWNARFLLQLNTSHYKFPLWAISLWDEKNEHLMGQNRHIHTLNQGKVHSVEQNSISLVFCTPRSGSYVMYSFHHNLSRFSFPIFVHSWHFPVFHSLQSITPHIY